MAPAVEPADSLLLRLYALYELPDAGGEDGAAYLGLQHLGVASYGSQQTQALVRALRQAPGGALGACRLELAGRPVANLAGGSVAEWFDWAALAALAAQGVLCAGCIEILSAWQPVIERYGADGVWLGTDPETDCLSVLDDLARCETCGPRYTMRIRLDKHAALTAHLSGFPASALKQVSGLVWYSPQTMQRALGDFRGFLRAIAAAAEGPVALFFYVPGEEAAGDFFSITALRAAQLPAAAAADCRALRRRSRSESRPDTGDTYHLSPALLLRQARGFPATLSQPPFTQGPFRSLLLYTILAWLADHTHFEAGVTHFVLPAAGEGTQELLLDIGLDDVRLGGASVFGDPADWRALCCQLTSDIDRSAGRRAMRKLWNAALVTCMRPDVAAAGFFAVVAAARQEFIRLERQPLAAGDVEPDLTLSIFQDETRDGVELQFALHAPKLNYFHKDMGGVSLNTLLPGGGTGHIYNDLSEMARSNLDKVLEPSTENPGMQSPNLRKLLARSHDLWRKLIPEALKTAYAQVMRGKTLTVMIASDDPSFPWEMLKPYGDLSGGAAAAAAGEDLWWALQFDLARWLAGYLPPAAELSMSKVCCVATEAALPAVAQEVEYFRRPGISLYEPKSLNELFDALSSDTYDVIHFACHGHFAEEQPDSSLLQLPDGSLLEPEDLDIAAIGPKFRSSRPLVFLNSCQSGRDGWTFSGLGGWAHKFIDLGCGAFIGCGWEVADVLAAGFATSFYEAFEGGMPLGAAVRSARQKIRRDNEANPTWLAYYLYGDPSCRLRASP